MIEEDCWILDLHEGCCILDLHEGKTFILLKL